MYIARRKIDDYVFILRANGPVRKTWYTVYPYNGTPEHRHKDFIADDDCVYITGNEAKDLLKGRKMIRRGTQIEI